MSIVVIKLLIRQMQQKKIVYTHQSHTAPLNTMGITMSKSEKLENSSF